MQLLRLESRNVYLEPHTTSAPMLLLLWRRAECLPWRSEAQPWTMRRICFQTRVAPTLHHGKLQESPHTPLTPANTPEQTRHAKARCAAGHRHTTSTPKPEGGPGGVEQLRRASIPDVQDPARRAEWKTIAGILRLKMERRRSAGRGGAIVFKAAGSSSRKEGAADRR